MPPRRASRHPSIEVLRIGHRPGRDPRLTTHVALVARAFGADRLLLHPPDPALSSRLEAVRARWGGAFEVRGCRDWRSMVRSFPGPKVHLTMYGRRLSGVLRRLRSARRLLVIVGGAKVPGRLYGMATHNIAIGSQPHSEVGALAVFLDRLIGPPPPDRFQGALQKIVPSARGKRVEAKGP